MKKLLVVFLVLLFAGCAPKPEIVDDGFPGQIRVVVYQDGNRNEVKDPEEPGLLDEVALGQDVSCPAQNIDEMTVLETDTSGQAVFQDLQPGVYCVMYMGRESVTTKLTVEVYLSSEQEAVAAFGVAEE